MNAPRIIAVVAVAACFHLLTAPRPITCREAGKMGAKVRKLQDRMPIRERSRQMYIERDMAVPAALQDEVQA